MQVLFVDGSQVRDLLPMEACIAAMERGLRTLAADDAVQPLRTAMWLPGQHGLLGLMPGYLGGDVQLLGIKVVSVMPANQAAGLPSHQGVVVLFEPAHGRPVALVDAEAITAIRTAAVSALATRYLARADATVLAILGSGVQAHSHLAAMLAVRPVRTVRVWSRNPSHAQAFAEQARTRYAIDAEPVLDAESAVRGASLVCTTTAAREPVLAGRWLTPGTHINAVGACFPAARELDAEAVARARLFVDRRESALAEAGDFLLARAEGAVGDEHIVGELGEVLTGRVSGRCSDEDVTLFESLGLAAEDLAAARLVYDRALAAGRGQPLELEGAATRA